MADIHEGHHVGCRHKDDLGPGAGQGAGVFGKFHVVTDQQAKPHAAMIKNHMLIPGSEKAVLARPKKLCLAITGQFRAIGPKDKSSVIDGIGRIFRQADRQGCLMAAAHVAQSGNHRVPTRRSRRRHRIIARQKQFWHHQHVDAATRRIGQCLFDNTNARRDVPGGRNRLLQTDNHQLRRRVQI